MAHQNLFGSSQHLSEAAQEPLKYRSAPGRRAQIVELLQIRPYLSQTELSQILGVSEMTVRRDAHELADRGLAIAVSGGLSRPAYPLDDNTFQRRTDRGVLAKRLIAAVAFTMIKPQSTVALDAGTTMVELACLLETSPRLTVVTASLPVMRLLADRPTIQLIGLGGPFHPRTAAFAGPTTIDALHHLHVAQLFLGARAVGPGGTYEGNPWDAEIKRSMIEAADEVVLLADSTKFESTAIALVGPLSAIGTAVVDDAISKASREMLEAAGVRVVIATADPVLQPTLKESSA